MQEVYSCQAGAPGVQAHPRLQPQTPAVHVGARNYPLLAILKRRALRGTAFRHSCTGMIQAERSSVREYP
jgi:hypothetical protein